jgi:hypothetical protein
MSTGEGRGESEHDRRVLDALEQDLSSSGAWGLAASWPAWSWSAVLTSFALLCTDGMLLTVATGLGSPVLVVLAVLVFPLVALPLLPRRHRAEPT